MRDVVKFPNVEQLQLSTDFTKATQKAIIACELNKILPKLVRRDFT